MSVKTKCMWSDYGRTFVTALITAFLVMNKPLFDFGANDWKALASAAVVSWLPVVLVALNPNDPRYGAGSVPAE